MYNYIGAPNQLLLPLNVVDAGAGVGRQPWKAEPPTQHRPQPTYTYPNVEAPSAMRPSLHLSRPSCHLSAWPHIAAR